MPPTKSILIIEDEPAMVLGLTDALSFEGYQVVSAGTGRQGVSLATAQRPDLVILDLMLPDTNGYEVCAELRRLSRAMPILILSARSQETDENSWSRRRRGRLRHQALQHRRTRCTGARDPPSRRPRERNRRARPHGEAQLNLAGHTVVLHGKESVLSFYEVALVRLLLERSGQVVSRDEILDKVWGVSAINARAVDNFIVKLRKKVERFPDKPQHILTVYGVGYKLVP